MLKLKRFLIIFVSTVIVLMIFIILFISPLTKYLIEKYDFKFTGRQISLSWAYVNPFTGYIYLNDLFVLEECTDTTFISVKGLSAQIALSKIFRHSFEIDQLTLDHPYGIIVKNGTHINIDDLLEKFVTDVKSNISKTPIRLTISNIKVIDGEFYFIESIIPINYFIKNVNIESSGFWTDVDSVSAKFSLLPGIGTGNVQGNFTFNTKSLKYHYDLLVQQLDLDIIQQYLKSLANYGAFRANLDAHIISFGNLNAKEDVTIKGNVAINDFHFGKNIHDDYASFKKLSIGIIELSPKNRIYFYDTVLLISPFFKYERYDYLDNIQTVFGKDGSNLTAANDVNANFNLVIEIANYIKVISKNFFQSNYRINRLAINDGDLKFNDYALAEKFSMDLKPLFISADSVDKSHLRVKMNLSSKIKPYGTAIVNLSINPKDSSDFDLNYHIQNVPIPIFNPYLISYTSLSLDRGIIEIEGKWNVRNGFINSKNHLLVIDPRISKRLRNRNTKWLPLRLIMAFVRERGNVIDFEVPITGNLLNPTFHWRDVVLDVIKNIFIKPVTIPYRTEVRTVEKEIEKSLMLKWEMNDYKVNENQFKFLGKINDFLMDNPNATITVTPQNYKIKEMEYLLFFEAKKKFYLNDNNINKPIFTLEDSLCVNKLSIRNLGFLKYLDRKVNGRKLFTIQDKCNLVVEDQLIEDRFIKLNKAREIEFLSLFKGLESSKRIHFTEGHHIISPIGYSYYRIEYRGELPKSLLKAYDRMNDLNNGSTRKKFYLKRKKNTISL